MAMQARQNLGTGMLELQPHEGVKKDKAIHIDLRGGKHESLDLETSVDEFSSSDYSTSEEESTITDESDRSQAEIMGVVLTNPTMVSSINVPQVEEGKLAKILAKDLTQEEKQAYLAMLEGYPRLFIDGYDQITGVSVVQHHINLKDGAKPVVQRLRRLGVIQQDALLSEETYVKENLIEGETWLGTFAENTSDDFCGVLSVQLDYSAYTISLQQQEDNHDDAVFTGEENDPPTPTDEEIDLLDAIITNSDVITPPTDAQKHLLWQLRHSLVENALALPRFLMAVPWNKKQCVLETHSAVLGFTGAILGFSAAVLGFTVHRAETVAVLQPDKDKDEADDEFCESGISKKPKCSEDVGKDVDIIVAVTPEANMPLLGDGSNACNDPQIDWDHLLDFANSLLQEYAKHNESKAVDIPENDVLEVTMDTPRVLQVLTAFHEKAAIFFFTGRLPPMHRIRQWLNFLLQSDAIDEIFDGPRGFFEIMFKTPEARQLALQKVPLFFDGQLVHAVPWRPLAEFQEILKQECPIWVEVESCPAMYWPLLHEAMQSLGKVLVPPRSRSNNRNRLCMLWNTAHPPPAWLRLKSQGMRHMHFRLHWGAFAGHCFQCGQLGHFMAECKRNDKDKGVPVEVHSQVAKEPSHMLVEHSENARDVQQVDVCQVEDKGKQVVEEETPWKEVVSRKSDARSRDRQPFVQGPGSYNLHSRSTKVNEPSSSLAFDRQGRIITPWDKRYSPARGNQWNQPSSSRQPSSGVLQNAFAVLGDYMGDVCAALAANERQGRSQPSSQ
ncbi:hypothetical protein L7F22_009489 [Adiantum nelumboides]|nr:hypothetical protein [Adiantum nelumboides]